MKHLHLIVFGLLLSHLSFGQTVKIQLGTTLSKLDWELGTLDFSPFDQTFEEKKKAIDHVLENYYATEISKRWQNDINEIVDQIPIWAETSFLADHLDVSKIGLFGHSQGGSAVGDVLLNNPNISAGVNLDGVQWGKLVDTALHKPFLSLSSDWADDHPDFNEVAYYNSTSDDFYVAEIKNSGHSNFMDIPFMINLPGLNEAGDINPERAIRITSELVIQFFDKYLNNKETNLLELSNSYRELKIVKKYQ